MKSIYYLKICALTISTTLLPGCGISLFSHRDTNPSIQDTFIPQNIFKPLYTSESVNVFSTTASRREVITKQSHNEFVSCAEPSPDVGETFVSAISDAMKLAATSPQTGINGSLSNDYARAVATQITPLVYRTQTLQLYRDAIHSHCIDRMNGWIFDTKEHGKLDITITPEAAKTVKDQDGKDVIIPVNTVNIKPYVNDYNQMKAFYFVQAMEALKVEVPLALKAQEEFFKNNKNSSLTAEQILQVANATKGNGGATVVSTPTGTNIITNSTGPVTIVAKCDDGDAKYCKEKGKEPTGTPPKCADGEQPQYCLSGLLPK